MGLGTTAYLGGASCSNRTHSHHAVISDQSDQLIVFFASNMEELTMKNGVTNMACPKKS